MAKKVAKKSTAPKVHYQIKLKIANEAVDAYKREHKLEEYADKTLQVIKDGVEDSTFPAYSDIAEPLSTTMYKINKAQRLTSHEARLQEFDLALFHLRTANRYINSAYTE